MASDSDHDGDWRRVRDTFRPEDTFNDLNEVQNLWQASSEGDFLFRQLLAAKCATVAAAYAVGKDTMELRPAQVRRHPEWLWTWDGSGLRINGEIFQRSAEVVNFSRINENHVTD
jgi:hypothetical protein